MTRAALVLLATSVVACSRPAAPVRQQPPGGATGAGAVSGAGVVAEVNGGPIMGSELEQRAGNKLARLRQEEYEIRSQVLEDLIAERLVAGEAEKRGLSAEALLKQEVDAKAALPGDAQVLSIYEQHKSRFGSASRDEAIAQIRQILGERAISERRQAYVGELRSKARVAVRLAPPRVVVELPKGAPATGPENAPVTIVEFTDYQCPYCHRAQSVIDQVLQRYSGKVRFVHLDFPLDGHPEAMPAARAARCAGEQGKFWEYHRGLMSQPGSLDVAGLKSRAERLGIDVGRFGSCIASDRFDAAIEAELRQGSELGVTGTPAYFVNGRMISGARPIESFVEVIESELNSAQGS